MTPALSMPLAGLALALTGAAGAGVVGVAVVIAVLMLALTLPVAVGLPRPRVAASVIGVVGLAAVASAAVEGLRVGGQPGSLRVALPVLAFTFAVAVLGQILRRDGRSDLVVTMSITASAAAIAALGSLWIPLSRTVVSEGALVASGLALAAVGVVLLVIERLRLDGLAVDVALGGAVIAAAVAASAAALLIEPGPWSPWQLGVVGAVAGAVALVVHVGVMRLSDERSPAESVVGVVVPAPESGAGGLREVAAAGDDLADQSLHLDEALQAQPRGETTVEPVGLSPSGPLGGSVPADILPAAVPSGGRVAIARARRQAMAAEHHELAQLAAASMALLLPAGSVYTAARILVG